MECDDSNPNASLPSIDREVIVSVPAALPTAPAPNNSNTKDVYVKFDDIEILDCFVCFEPLDIPVFQCVNGHFLCSACSCNVGHKCPQCSTLILNIRCRAMEKVLEAIKVPCPNANYGCNQILRYCDKRHHEKTCLYVPCSCLHPGCDYLHNSIQLGLHFSNDHFFNRIPFEYGEFSNVSLRINKKFAVLQARTDGKLFIICNNVYLKDLMSHAMFVCHIGPNLLVPQFNYEIKAKSNVGSWIELPQTSVEIHTQGVESYGILFEPEEFLSVPYGFFSICSRRVELQVQINRVSGN